MNPKAFLSQTIMVFLLFSQRGKESTCDPGETEEQRSPGRPPSEAGVPRDRHAAARVLLEEGQ